MKGITMRSLLCLAAIGTILALPNLAFADAEGHANSQNMPLAKYTDGNASFRVYTTAADATKTFYSEQAQASNEGGTTGPKMFGPDAKFTIQNDKVYAKSWNDLEAAVPDPGVTVASGIARGATSTPLGAPPGSSVPGFHGFHGVRPGSGNGGG